MNQFKRWVPNNAHSTSVPAPPPSIRTNNSYDGNDETFSLVALNLLSRFAYFNLSPEDAICETLATPRERSSFLEALSVRKMYSSQHRHHLSPSTVSLIKTVDDNFGRDLVRIVEMEGGATEMTFNPAGLSASQNNEHTHEPETSKETVKPHPMNRRRSEVTSSRSSSKGDGSGKKARSFFFPETSGFFGVSTGKSKKRNIDWKLAEAIEQVSSLRLDGVADENSLTATESTMSSSSVGYEPPSVAAPSEAQHQALNGICLNYY